LIKGRQSAELSELKTERTEHEISLIQKESIEEEPEEE
jgi:hypothetical protein